MTKWRPPGWERQFAHISERDRFEAGADALLVALRGQARMIHDSPVLIAEHTEAAVKEGYWVFIPDDTKEAHGH